MDDVNYSRDGDYYELFGIAPSASENEIAKAHKRVAKTCHPDLHPDKEWATERFKDITVAYTVLKDPATKGEYDRLRWAELGQDKTRPRRKGLFRRLKKSEGNLDSERHHKDRWMSYFILGIEIAMMVFILVIVAYRAITKHKF